MTGTWWDKFIETNMVPVLAFVVLIVAVANMKGCGS